MTVNLTDKHVMIVGAGATILQYKNEVVKYIQQNKIVIIGINKMTSVMIPDYHLWTNEQRYRAQHDCIDPKSNLLFGSGMPISLIRKFWNGDFEKINYVHDSKYEKTTYKNGVIYGNLRTAGLLAIMIAHTRGASKIDIIGMDGFTLHSKSDLDKKVQNHHCYGKGYTDDAGWLKCVKKDFLVNKGLYAIKKYGVSFSILTPTKFKDFYDPGVLEKYG